MYVTIGGIGGDETADDHGRFWFEGLHPGFETTPKCFSGGTSVGNRPVRDPNEECGDEIWSFAKTAEKASPTLFLHSQNDNALSLPCKICFTDSNDTFPRDSCYFHITLDGCFVKQYRMTGVDETTGKPLEEIHLWAEKTLFNYSNYVEGWDVVHNTPWNGGTPNRVVRGRGPP